MTWILEHLDDIWELTVAHIWLSGLPLLKGLALALPIGWFAHRWPRARTAVLTTSGLLYTIPSLALFVILPLVLGTPILSPINVVIAMTLYTIALLVRTVVDGLSSVPDDVALAATAMGYSRWRRVLAVELPLAVPVIAAGLRVAAVSNVSIVSVASIIGTRQLGLLLTDGFNRAIPGALFAGILASVLLALAFDGLIRGAERLLTPWRRAHVGGAT